MTKKDDEPREPSGDDEKKRKEDSSKGAGRKHDVQPDPEDQRGRADPKEGEGRGAF